MAFQAVMKLLISEVTSPAFVFQTSAGQAGCLSYGKMAFQAVTKLLFSEVTSWKLIFRL